MTYSFGLFSSLAARKQGNRHQFKYERRYLIVPELIAPSEPKFCLSTDMFNVKAADNIAVEVSSITGVSNAPQPAPQHRVVPCHHMNYFVHPESVAVLQRYLGVETVEI